MASNYEISFISVYFMCVIIYVTGCSMHNQLAVNSAACLTHEFN